MGLLLPPTGPPCPARLSRVGGDPRPPRCPPGPRLVEGPRPAADAPGLCGRPPDLVGQRPVVEPHDRGPLLPARPAAGSAAPPALRAVGPAGVGLRPVRLVVGPRRRVPGPVVLAAAGPAAPVPGRRPGRHRRTRARGGLLGLDPGSLPPGGPRRRRRTRPPRPLPRRQRHLPPPRRGLRPVDRAPVRPPARHPALLPRGSPAGVDGAGRPHAARGGRWSATASTSGTTRSWPPRWRGSTSAPSRSWPYPLSSSAWPSPRR